MLIGYEVQWMVMVLNKNGFFSEAIKLNYSFSNSLAITIF